jgi:hypothetical protein
MTQHASVRDGSRHSPRRGHRPSGRPKLRIVRDEVNTASDKIHDAYRSGLTTKQRFAQFRRDNPLVEKWLVAECRDLKARGIDRYSMDVLFGRLRYERILKLHGWLNNDYRPLFARRLMRRYPDLKGLFETRRPPMHRSGQG